MRALGTTYNLRRCNVGTRLEGDVKWELVDAKYGMGMGMGMGMGCASSKVEF
jgi:hypothetical protein